MFANSPGRGTSALAIAHSLGLRGTLKICLDCRDSRSDNDGSQILDLSGNGHDFNRGDNVTSTTYPTFTGTANSRTAYRAFDAGDYLTLETANPSWVNDLHKANGAYWVAAGLYHATDTGAILGTNGTSLGAATGINATISAGDALVVRARNAGSLVLSATSTALLTENAWNFVAWTVNSAAGASGGFLQINAAAETFDATYTSPAAGDATTTLNIGALGGGAVPLGAGDRLAFILIGTGGKTAAQLTSMFRAYRRGLGL
jgi:hypothetical protein